jgi:hypothetical protein
LACFKSRAVPCAKPPLCSACHCYTVTSVILHLPHMAQNLFRLKPKIQKGQAVEGTQTNFFVVKNGAVYTAPPSEVLVGTIRVMVERMCHEAGIPFIEESPSAAEHRLVCWGRGRGEGRPSSFVLELRPCCLSSFLWRLKYFYHLQSSPTRSWEGAFLSSTSRLVLAINELRVYEDAVGGDRKLAGTFPLPVSPIISQLAEVRSEEMWEGRASSCSSELVCSEHTWWQQLSVSRTPLSTFLPAHIYVDYICTAGAWGSARRCHGRFKQRGKGQMTRCIQEDYYTFLVSVRGTGTGKLSYVNSVLLDKLHF